MSKALLLIAETVVVINIIYVLLPNGTFEKYSRHIFGLILMLVFAGTVTKVDISSDILYFDKNIPVYNQQKIIDVVEHQTKDIIEEKIVEQLTNEGISIKNVTVSLENDTLNGIEIVSGNNTNNEKIISLVAEYCGVNDNIIVVK